jgi:predicted methyltransferase
MWHGQTVRSTLGVALAGLGALAWSWPAVDVTLTAGPAPVEQRGGQTGLTDAQIRSAAAEVPQLLKELALEPGMTVADVGAGFGAWTMAFAKALGPSGRVYATEVGTAQLESLRASAKGLTNVTVLQGAERSASLPPQCCDAILLRDVYHHLTQPADVVRSLVAALKTGGTTGGHRLSACARESAVSRRAGESRWPRRAARGRHRGSHRGRTGVGPRHARLDTRQRAR